MQGGKKATLKIGDMGIARNAIGNKKLGDKAIKVGSVIRVMKLKTVVGRLHSSLKFKARWFLLMRKRARCRL